MHQGKLQTLLLCWPSMALLDLKLISVPSCMVLDDTRRTEEKAVAQVTPFSMRPFDGRTEIEQENVATLLT